MILSVFTCWLGAHCSKARFGQRTNAREVIAPPTQAEEANSARSSHGRAPSRIRVKGFPEFKPEFKQNSTRMLQPSCFAPMFACFVWELLSHHLNCAFGQRATHAIALQRRLSDFSGSTPSPNHQNNQFDMCFRVSLSLVHQAMLVCHSKSRFEHRG